MAGVTGMMWQWDRKTGLKEAARQAIRHYERTRGRQPRICYANQAVLAIVASAGDSGQVLIVEGIPVCPLKGIAPFHLWVVEKAVDSDETQGDSRETQHKS